jgi:hypothetical protein
MTSGSIVDALYVGCQTSHASMESSRILVFAAMLINGQLLRRDRRGAAQLPDKIGAPRGEGTGNAGGP